MAKLNPIDIKGFYDAYKKQGLFGAGKKAAGTFVKGLAADATIAILPYLLIIAAVVFGIILLFAVVLGGMAYYCNQSYFLKYGGGAAAAITGNELYGVCKYLKFPETTNPSIQGTGTVPPTVQGSVVPESIR